MQRVVIQRVIINVRAVHQISIFDCPLPKDNETRRPSNHPAVPRPHTTTLGQSKLGPSYFGLIKARAKRWQDFSN
jgi:hypothetical protein